jgi:hypothetical protein
MDIRWGLSAGFLVAALAASVMGEGCKSDDEVARLEFFQMSGISLTTAYSTKSLGTCSGSGLSLDLKGIEFNDPALNGHNFSWKVDGSTAIVFDDTLGDLFEGTLPSGVSDDEIDLPSAGIVMTSMNAAVTGTLTATGNISCSPGAGDGGQSGDSPTTDASTTGADAPNADTCTTFTITACTPATGPLGTKVKLTGSGFSCFRTSPGAFSFRTTIDGYTYLPADYQIVSDTEIQTLIPTHGDGETTLKVGGNCKGEFDALSNVVTLEPASAVLFTITGTPNCP